MGCGKIFPCAHVCVCIYMSVLGTVTVSSWEIVGFPVFTNGWWASTPCQTRRLTGFCAPAGISVSTDGVYSESSKHTYVLRNVNKYHGIWNVCEMFCSQGNAWKEGWCCLFSTSVLFVPVGGGNLPYHERADKDTARLPHRFPHVTGPTLHLPYLPHFSGCLQSAVSHCVCSCRSDHLDQIQLHADFISSRVVVCAVKLIITLGSQLYRTRFLFYVDSAKPIRVSWPFINLLG